MSQVNELKSIGRFIIIGATVALLTGCGGFNPEKADASSVSISKEGKITSVTIDSFSEDYYDIEELEEMANSEISSFNTEYGEDSAVLSSIKKEDDSIRMIMEFESASDYSHFNQKAMFYGTVAEAISRGYELPSDLVDAEGNSVTSETLSGLSDEHIIIMAEKMNVITPYKIKYMTSGVTLEDSNEAILSGTSEDSNVYLILVK